MRINWKKGSSTVVVYIAFMWVIVLAAVLFIEYFNMFTNIGKTQLYADLVADGSAFMGNNGWSLDKDEAQKAKKRLVNYNDAFFDDTSVSIGYEKNGTASTGDDTVKATAKLETSMVTDDTEISKTKTAKTQITYSGGMRIVLEAWKHSYNFFHSDVGQTHYVFGGGHGNDTEWEQFADCSGFVSGVYRKCGYNVPSWACTWTFETMGTLVGTGAGTFDKARPGDIILYWWSDANSVSSHVAIYAGKYNGVHYQVHCSGGTANTYQNQGVGSKGQGAILAPVSTGAAKIMIRRIVNSDAKAYKAPEITIPGLTKDQTDVYFNLSSMGFSDQVAAAIMGNWQQESHCSPITREGSWDENSSYNTAYAEDLKNHRISEVAFVHEGWDRFTSGDGSPRSEGFGLAQWTTVDPANPMGDRKAQLWEYTNGKVYDLALQVGFAVSELAPKWGGAAAGTPSEYVNVSYSEFLNCKDPEKAAKLFLAHFEGVWDGTDGIRSSYAKNFYNAIANYKK